MTRSSQASAIAKAVVRRFRGKEAIYIEGGVLRVRVTHISMSVTKRLIYADIVEVPTEGLGLGMFDHRITGVQGIRRFRIGAGYLTTVGDNTWAMGYGGWMLFFSPKFVNDVVELAAQLSRDNEAAPHAKFFEWFKANDFYEKQHRVFPDSVARAHAVPRFVRVLGYSAWALAFILLIALIYVTVRFS